MGEILYPLFLLMAQGRALKTPSTFKPFWIPPNVWTVQQNFPSLPLPPSFPLPFTNPPFAPAPGPRTHQPTVIAVCTVNAVYFV